MKHKCLQLEADFRQGGSLPEDHEQMLAVQRILINACLQGRGHLPAEVAERLPVRAEALRRHSRNQAELISLTTRGLPAKPTCAR